MTQLVENPGATQPHETSPGVKVPVTVLIPTLNEAKNLPSCLDHLGWADEVVLVDSNSTDRTHEIAESYGARVIPFTWNGQWPKKRNWALRHAELKHSWVLMVDADEWIVPELADEISQAIRTDSHAGYWINRRFMFMGRWLKHCGYYPSWNLRLVKRGHAEFEKLEDVGDTGSGDNEVHEHVMVDGSTGYLRADMLHFAYPTIATFVEKHNRYSNWEAAVQWKGSAGGDATKNGTVSWRRRLKKLSRYLPLRPTQRFLYSYVLRAVSLDGRPGFTFCRLLAMYEFLSAAKFEELRYMEKRKV